MQIMTVGASDTRLSFFTQVDCQTRKPSGSDCPLESNPVHTPRKLNLQTNHPKETMRIVIGRQQPAFWGVLGRGLVNVIVNEKAHWEPGLSAIQCSRLGVPLLHRITLHNYGVRCSGSPNFLA